MLLRYPKSADFSFFKWKQGVLLVAAVLLVVGGCASSGSASSSSEQNSAQQQLSASLSNSFSRGWFDKCNSLQSIAETATEKAAEPSAPSAQYLLGYLEGSKPQRVGYFLNNVYSNQSALKNPMITQQVKQSLDVYTTAEDAYLQQLQKRLEQDNRIPQEEAFQTNTKALAELVAALNINPEELKNEESTTVFRENLEKAAKRMDDAFAQPALQSSSSHG
jgi:uncharacterized protein YceK